MVASIERQSLAMELREAGLSYSEIGKELGVTKQAAHKLVVKAKRNEGVPYKPLMSDGTQGCKVSNCDRVHCAKGMCRLHS